MGPEFHDTFWVLAHAFLGSLSFSHIARQYPYLTPLLRPRYSTS